MHRNLILLVSCFLLLFLLPVSASAWEIDGDRVWQNDSNCYISVEPHTLHGSGWVVITVKTHSYSGNIDACLGFNTTVAKPSKPAWKNHWENTTTYHQAYFYNVTSIEPYDGSVFDYGNDYNTYQRTITYYRPVDWNEETNTTIYELATANVSFDSYEEVGDGDDYMIYWHTDHSKWVEWTQVPSSRYHSVTYDFMGFDKWYYATDLTVQAGKEYTLRFWVDVPVSLERSTGKFFFAVKPSTETIGEAVANGHFYYLDPWWDTQWNTRRELRINNTGGSELSHYQIFVNLTDTPINATSLRVVNETAGTTVPHWNESVDANGNVTGLWFNCTHIPANSWLNGTYYIYYGNSDASSTSDANTSFIFFDDFESYSTWSDAEANDWVLDGTNAGKYADILTTNGDTYAEVGSSGSNTAGADALIKHNVSFPSSGFEVKAKINLHKTDCKAAFDIIDSSGSQVIGIYRGDSTNWCFLDSAGSLQSVSASRDTQDTWRWVTFQFIPGTRIILTIDGNTDVDTTDVTSNVPTAVQSSIGCAPGDKSRLSEVRVRKYASPEPSVVVCDAVFASNYPLPPVNLQSSSGLFWDTGKTWINYTWAPNPNSIAADSYNVSLNNIWYNGSPAYHNTTIDFPNWANISVYAYNATYGTLSNQSADGKEHALISLATVYRHVEETSQETSSQDNTTVVALLLLCICLVIVGWRKRL